MQCCMNGALIIETPKFLAPIFNETKHAIQIVNTYATNKIIMPLKLTKVTSQFNVRKPT